MFKYCAGPPGYVVWTESDRVAQSCWCRISQPTNSRATYKASYGNDNYVGLERRRENVPLVADHKLLVRIVGSYQDRDGFTRDIVWNKIGMIFIHTLDVSASHSGQQGD
jgi:hypothetical protein